MQRGVKNELLPKYREVAANCNESNENENLTVQGMTKQKDYTDDVRNTRAYRDQQSATDSRRVFRWGTDETARAADWEQSAADSKIVLRKGVGPHKLTEISNLPWIPKELCLGKKQSCTSC